MMMPERVITDNGTAIQNPSTLCPVPLPGSATKASSEQHSRAKMLPRQFPWKPKDETTQNHKEEGDDAGVLDTSQSLVPYTIERDPTMQIPYARKEHS